VEEVAALPKLFTDVEGAKLELGGVVCGRLKEWFMVSIGSWLPTDAIVIVAKGIFRMQICLISTVSLQRCRMSLLRSYVSSCQGLEFGVQVLLFIA